MGSMKARRQREGKTNMLSHFTFALIFLLALNDACIVSFHDVKHRCDAPFCIVHTSFIFLTTICNFYLINFSLCTTSIEIVSILQWILIGLKCFKFTSPMVKHIMVSIFFPIIFGITIMKCVA